MTEDLVERLRKRAEIRRNIPTRKSVQNGEPDRIADLLEEAADALEATISSTGYLDVNRRLNKEWAIQNEKIQMLEKECAALRQQLRQMEYQTYGGVSQ
jgi:predicted nuclease with TOPRIM domain